MWLIIYYDFFIYDVEIYWVVYNYKFWFFYGYFGWVYRKCKKYDYRYKILIKKD